MSAILDFARRTQRMFDAPLAEHGLLTRKWCERLVTRLALPAEEIDRLLAAAELHDIGKAFVPAMIVGKTGPLGAAEARAMRMHPELGGELFTDYPEMARVIRAHHEWFDGSGYPDKLKEVDIPYLARIVAVADSIAAMREDRPYKEKMPMEKIAAEIKAGSGKQFDPALAKLGVLILKEAANG